MRRCVIYSPAGFTLLEVLTALTILSVGLAALGTAVATGFALRRHGRATIIANRLAQNESALVQYAAHTTSFLNDTTWTRSIGGNTYQVLRKTEQPEESPSTCLFPVTIHIRWGDNPRESLVFQLSQGRLKPLESGIGHE